MSRNVDRETNIKRRVVRYDEPKDFDEGRRDFAKALAIGLGITALGGVAGLAWLTGSDQTDGFTEKVIGGEIPEEPQLKARTAEQVNPEISLRARVEEKIASAQNEKSLITIRANTSIPEGAVEGLKARVKNFEYQPAVQEIVTAVYKADFYESDGKTLKPEISRSIDTLRKQTDLTIIDDVQKLAFYYFLQIERVVLEQGDLSLALRFADLAGRLEPNLTPKLFEAIDRAVKINEEFRTKNTVNLVLEPTKQIDGREKDAKDIEPSRHFEINLRNVFGPEFVPNPEPQNTHTKVVIDSGITTESDNRERTRTLGPGIVWSPEVLAAYLHRRITLGLSLQEGRADQMWKAIETRPFKEVIGAGVFGEVIEVVSGGLGVVNPLLPGVVEGVIKNSAENLVVVTFQQEICSLVDTPCTARAIVLRGLVERGLNYYIWTLGEMVLDSVSMTISGG